jgi:hypothetical protein
MEYLYIAMNLNGKKLLNREFECEIGMGKWWEVNKMQDSE